MRLFIVKFPAQLFKPQTFTVPGFSRVGIKGKALLIAPHSSLVVSNFVKKHSLLVPDFGVIRGNLHGSVETAHCFFMSVESGVSQSLHI